MTVAVGIGADKPEFNVFADIERKICERAQFLTCQGSVFIISVFALDWPITIILCLCNKVYSFIRPGEIEFLLYRIGNLLQLPYIFKQSDIFGMKLKKIFCKG